MGCLKMSEKSISDIVDEHDTLDFYIAIVAALSKQIPYTTLKGKCLCGVGVDKSTKYCGQCGQKLRCGE